MKIIMIYNKMKDIIGRAQFQTICIFLFVLGCRAFNMFNFPHYEGNDEGAYMSQGWSVAFFNRLSPYTYWYDHSPLGSIILAFFVRIFGSVSLFGNPINTGRFVIFLISFVSLILLYKVAISLTHSRLIGYIVIVFYGLLPLSIIYGRMVLLDNILIPFLLASILLIICKKEIKNSNLIFSAILAALSFLIKEITIVFLPIYILFLVQTLESKRKFVGVCTWLSFYFSVVILYPLLALFKTELFVSEDKVSLIGTLFFHAKRGASKYFWQSGSDFLYIFNRWIEKDYFSVIAVMLVFLFSLVLYLWKKLNSSEMFIFNLMAIYIGFLIRGGIILDFYLQLLMLLSSIMLGVVVNKLRFGLDFKKSKVVLIIFVLLFGILNIQQFYINPKAFVQNESIGFNMVNKYIFDNIDNKAFIAADCGTYLQLRNPIAGKSVYPNSHWYWKVNFDPEVKKDVLNNNSMNIDYVVVNNQFMYDLSINAIPFTQKAYYESKTIADYSNTELANKLNRVIKSNKVYVENSYEIATKDVLSKITSNTLDINTLNQTMLNSVMIKDKGMFNILIDYSISSGVYSKARLSEKFDFIYSLILSKQVWGNAEIEKMILDMGEMIWNNNVIEFDSRLYITEETKDGNIITLDAGNYRSAIFKSFLLFGSKNSWDKLNQDFEDSLKQYGQSDNLFGNVVIIDKVKKEFKLSNLTEGKMLGLNNVSNNVSKIAFDSYLNQKLYGVDNNQKWLVAYIKEFKNIKTGNSITGNRMDNNYGFVDNNLAYYILLDLYDNGRAKDELWRDRFVERIDLNSNTLVNSDDNGLINNQILWSFVRENKINKF